MEILCFAVIIIFICFFAIIKNGNHADIYHPKDAKFVREAYQKNGFVRCYVEPDKITRHLIVELDDGRYGDLMIIKDVNGNNIEKNAFVPKDGSFEEIMKWLKRKNVKISSNPDFKFKEN